ncbi:kirre like nephrin family adhesion molecule 3, like, partial [Cetorhinus maximus]
NAAYFSQQPSDQVVVTGQSVTLNCVVSGYQGTVQWTKDGLALGGERDLPGWPRYWFLGDRNASEHNLHIEPAQLRDDAVYECQATRIGLRSRTARLNILVPPASPVILEGPLIKLRAGFLYNLTCLANAAKPAAGITWYRDGELQTSARYSKVLMFDGKRVNASSVLSILADSKDTGSKYTCRVSNQAAPAGMQVSAVLDVQYPPEVSLSVYPTPVLEGAKVKFTCLAAANPELVTYRWAKGQSSLAGVSGDSFEVEVDYTFFTEPITCTVTNSIGSTNRSLFVDVHFGPRLVSEPKSLIVDLGVDAVFTCAWVSNPPLTLTWTRKGSSVVLSNGVSLQLRAVTQGDSGIYVCKAIVPRIGVAEREVRLTINGPPIITSARVQRPIPGDRVRIQCFIASSPPPENIVWAWREKVLESGYLDRYSVETVTSDTGTMSTLSISSPSRVDFEPLYNCTAWNRFGLSTLAIKLQEQEVQRLGLVTGVTVGAGILIILIFAIVILTWHQRSGR